MRASRSWLGLLCVVLLFCLGVGLVSTVLPDDSNADSMASRYYDGDDDDAAVVDERIAVFVDMAFGTRAVVLPELAPSAFESPIETATPPPIVEQSPPPPLRSPPDV